MARVEQAVTDPTLKAEHRFLVCWAGKMGRQDRVDIVIRVVEHVVRDLGRVDCGFAILGDGECLSELQEMTDSLELTRWITFTGWLPEERVFSYFASADLGLDTSLQREVSPVKAMEYMAFGLPFLCFDLLETRRVAADAAVLVTPGDAAGLARALSGLLDDPDSRLRLGAVGYRRVRDELSWERQTPLYLRAIMPHQTSLPTPRKWFG
jgi:glycosyltransferase involved in cell wall biosynthesis